MHIAASDARHRLREHRCAQSPGSARRGDRGAALRALSLSSIAGSYSGCISSDLSSDSSAPPYSPMSSSARPMAACPVGCPGHTMIAFLRYLTALRGRPARRISTPML